MAVEKLTPAQDNAIICLLSEPTIKAAALAAGVGENTLHRWLDEPAFEQAYLVARRKALRAAHMRLARAADAATVRLMQLLASNNQAIQLRAAIAILDISHKAIEIDDLAVRLAAVEAELKGHQGDATPEL
jgi:hypothetical protein